MPDLTFLYDGTLLQVHGAEECDGWSCCIHNPSEHPLRHAPLHWRDDWGLMERRCEHGRYHPDPDDLAHKQRLLGEEYAWGASVHSCDRCCRG